MDKSEIESKVEELIELKQTIKKLLMQEKALKGELMPEIKTHGKMGNEFGYVYYSSPKGSETFGRKEVLQYLRDAYGSALADQVDEDCTKHGEPREVMYVKLHNL